MTDEDFICVGLTARRNADRRDYKVLMNAAGDSCDFAISPPSLRAIARRLGAALKLTQLPDYIVGFAPGGIPIAVGLAYELDLPVVIAYKCRLDLPDEVAWTEPHSVNSTFYFYGAREGQSVLLVDDEVDSGRTICNAVRALRTCDVEIIDVGCVVEILHEGQSSGRHRLRELGFDLKSIRRLDVDVCS